MVAMTVLSLKNLVTDAISELEYATQQLRVVLSQLEGNGQSDKESTR